MKALTICQPFAHLICLPDDHPRAKRVENRQWPTSYRGPLLIHAGKSRNWMDRNEEYGIPESDLVFGAIVGVANLADCVKLETRPGWNGGVVPDHAKRRWPWLLQHEHTEGPYCLVLTECRRFEKPIPYRGAQGLFDVPPGVVAEQMAAASVFGVGNA